MPIYAYVLAEFAISEKDMEEAARLGILPAQCNCLRSQMEKQYVDSMTDFLVPCVAEAAFREQGITVYAKEFRVRRGKLSDGRGLICCIADSK